MEIHTDAQRPVMQLAETHALAEMPMYANVEDEKNIAHHPETRNTWMGYTKRTVQL